MRPSSHSTLGRILISRPSAARTAAFVALALASVATSVAGASTQHLARLSLSGTTNDGSGHVTVRGYASIPEPTGWTLATGKAGPPDVAFTARVSSLCVASIVVQPLAGATKLGPLPQVRSFIKTTSQPGAIVAAPVSTVAEGHRSSPYGAWAVAVAPPASSPYAYVGGVLIRTATARWAGVYALVHAPQGCSSEVHNSRLAADLARVLRATSVHATAQ